MTDPVEHGSPQQDHEAFRRCLGQFATGVTVITASVGGKLVGITSNSFSSLSLDPPLVVWSIRRESRNFSAFAAASHFAVSILAADQLDLARAFARSADNKFEGVDWFAGVGASPVLRGVAASFECARTVEVDGGDHIMFMGHVERYCRYDRSPLLFAQGRYARVFDAPDGTPAIAEPKGHSGEMASGELTTSLMFRAYRAMLRLFEQVRQVEQLSYPEVILLNTVNRHPGKQLQYLVARSDFDIDAAHDVASELIGRGLFNLDKSDGYTLTPEGERRLSSIVSRSSEMRRQAFRNLAPEDLAATLRVINEIVAQGSRLDSAPLAASGNTQ